MEFAAARRRMVQQQLVARGIRDGRVLEAMETVPRHRFVPPGLEERAYDDLALPIGHGQTISQPFMVARMTEALGLRGGERVLEVGTGSGYQAAVLGSLGARVWSVEIVAPLAERARETLRAVGLGERVHVEFGDGTLGGPAGALYDAILVTAGAPGIPRPLLRQLADGAPLVLPMGEADLQGLVRIRRGPAGLVEEYLGACRFVRLHGAYGWEHG